MGRNEQAINVLEHIEKTILTRAEGKSRAEIYALSLPFLFGFELPANLLFYFPASSFFGCCFSLSSLPFFFILFYTCLTMQFL
jgi:ABC-type uncharacterized transport system permease subunit